MTSTTRPASMAALLCLLLCTMLVCISSPVAAQEDPSGVLPPELGATYMLTKNLSARKLQPYSQPDTVIFAMKAGLAEGEIDRQVIEITRSGKAWSVPARTGESETVALPRAWGWDSGDPNDQSPYEARLIVYAKDGSEHRSNTVTIPARVPDSRYARLDRPAGATVYKYSLCLFEFDKAHLGALNERILEEYVYPDIERSSKVEVIGHMDIIGLEEHNWRLSENRARSVVTEIRKDIGSGVYRTLEGRGVGEGDPIYTNDLPEGRFYNRTTQVVVITPAFASWE